jgi:asparagine N-glycosylation enzyme membrane subunit Stt3
LPKPSKRGRNPWWILVVIVIAGAMLGSVLASAVGESTYLSWLGRSRTIGLAPPVVIDLHVLTLTLGLTLRLNLAVVLGILIAAFVFRRL